MVDFGEVNYFAVLIATISTMVLGFLWYSPVLFGKQWMELVGLNREQMSGGGPLTYILTGLTALIGALILALLLTLANEVTITNGIMIGLLIGISISAKIGMNYLFENKKASLYFITIGYHLVSYLISGVIIGAM